MEAQTLKKLVKLEDIIAETEPLTGRGQYWHGHASRTTPWWSNLRNRSTFGTVAGTSPVTFIPG